MPEELPVRAAVPAVLAALAGSGTAVVTAPPGSGKTTVLPLALADAHRGRVIVAEPRRIATRAAARRMASSLGQAVGERVGYSVRGDRRVSGATQVEVVTTGLLVRRLQRDPELAGVDVVIIDEVHERQLDTDLALAFALDVRANLRPDLRLLATSATPDTTRLAALLGSMDFPAPVIDAPGRVFAVDLVYAPPPRPLPLLADARVDPRLLDHVAAVVRRAWAESTGDVLVFLPGEAEIRAVTRRLGDLEHVRELFGRQSAAEQDAVLRRSNHRRVVLTTAVAESSLTVPGVAVVVDAGLSREPRIDVARGLGSLTTVKVSKSSATQRAGRAGREGPGRAYRCWSELEQAYLDEHPAPEIATADLTGFALAAADWGHPGGDGLALLDRPPGPGLAAAQEVLLGLGAVDDTGRITPRGRRLAQVPAPPRLARALLDGADLVGAERAAELVAILSDDTGSDTDDDLAQRRRRLRDGRDAAATARWRQEVGRLRTAAGAGGPGIGDDAAAGVIAALAYPDRLARVRPGTGSYLMSGGSGAALRPGSGLYGLPWLAIAAADRPVGRADARIRLAAPIDEATAREIGAALLRTVREIRWEQGGLLLRERDTLGAVTLAERPLTDPDPARIEAAVLDGIARSGPAVFRWTDAGVRLRRRMALLHHHLGPPWPAVTDEALLGRLQDWVGADLARVRRASDLARIDTAAALRRLLPWPAAARLDALAPERLEVPSGSAVRVDYSAVEFDGTGSPVMAVRIQEVFGWLDAPRIADSRVPVLLHLLSPAGRPAAVTGDLASFWRQGYPQARAQLRSRYPRHAWPEDPLTAPPTRRVRN
ncbi:ATP-dependent helicase HrpB [Nakamurella panacisegetis]|uniref:ATP-dependent helicase HrpB n=1 Tax=Nakamurella panacisegetis TaxID=1090615 RepID=A0A1H0SKJ1_9ACTN|nr:ATP-dependent helicase HrpB [Nakamurella panacisegetis]SDP42264.1 ATP-dependent helicase HrpB [Nakamurella panacisegetis]